MKILKVGDITRAACDNCKSFQSATYDLRDVPFSDGSGIVKNVLVGVCDSCGSVITLPQQSTPLVARQMEHGRKGLEGRVPAHIVDILNVASSELGAGPDFASGLMKYYLHSLAEHKKAASTLRKYRDSELFSGKAQKRLSIKGRRVLDDVSVIKEASRLSSTTDVLKSVALLINDDVLEKRKPGVIKALKGVVAATA